MLLYGYTNYILWGVLGYVCPVYQYIHNTTEQHNLVIYGTEFFLTPLVLKSTLPNTHCTYTIMVKSKQFQPIVISPWPQVTLNML